MKNSLMLTMFSILMALLLLSPWAECGPNPVPNPGHMNIPYYQRQKEARQARQLEDLSRDCRNSRNMDPKCSQVYSGSTSLTTTSYAVFTTAALFVYRNLI